MSPWFSPKPNRNQSARVSRLAWIRQATTEGPRDFRYLPETREEFDVKANPSYLPSQCNLVPTGRTSQKEQKKQQLYVAMSGAVVASKPKRKSSTYSHPPCPLKKLVAEGYKHCSHAAPPCCTESRPKVTHCVVVNFASVLEQEVLPSVFADVMSSLRLADVNGQTDSFRQMRDHFGTG